MAKRTTEPPAAPERNGLDYRADGTIDLHLGARRVRLRAAQLEDYETLVGLWRDSLDELREMGSENSAWTVDLFKRLEERPEAERVATAEERAEDVKRARQMEDRTNELTIGWWLAAVGRMGDGPLTRGEMAGWMLNPSAINAAIEWWRSIPSLSGVQ